MRPRIYEAAKALRRAERLYRECIADGDRLLDELQFREAVSAESPFPFGGDLSLALWVGHDASEWMRRIAGCAESSANVFGDELDARIRRYRREVDALADLCVRFNEDVHAAHRARRDLAEHGFDRALVSIMGAIGRGHANLRDIRREVRELHLRPYARTRSLARITWTRRQLRTLAGLPDHELTNPSWSKVHRDPACGLPSLGRGRGAAEFPYRIDAVRRLAEVGRKVTPDCADAWGRVLTAAEQDYLRRQIETK